MNLGLDDGLRSLVFVCLFLSRIK